MCAAEDDTEEAEAVALATARKRAGSSTGSTKKVAKGRAGSTARQAINLAVSDEDSASASDEDTGSASDDGAATASDGGPAAAAAAGDDGAVGEELAPVCSSSQYPVAVARNCVLCGVCITVSAYSSGSLQMHITGRWDCASQMPVQQLHACPGADVGNNDAAAGCPVHHHAPCIISQYLATGLCCTAPVVVCEPKTG